MAGHWCGFSYKPTQLYPFNDQQRNRRANNAFYNHVDTYKAAAIEEADFQL